MHPLDAGVFIGVGCHFRRSVAEVVVFIMRKLRIGAEMGLGLMICGVPGGYGSIVEKGEVLKFPYAMASDRFIFRYV